MVATKQSLLYTINLLIITLSLLIITQSLHYTENVDKLQSNSRVSDASTNKGHWCKQCWLDYCNRVQVYKVLCLKQQ